MMKPVRQKRQFVQRSAAEVREAAALLCVRVGADTSEEVRVALGNAARRIRRIPVAGMRRVAQ